MRNVDSGHIIENIFHLQKLKFQAPQRTLTCACSIIHSEAAAFLALRTTAPTSCGSPLAASSAGGATFCCCSTCVYEDDMLSDFWQ